MKEKEKSEIPQFELEPDDNTVAYCQTCQKPIFIGNDKTRVGHHYLRVQIMDHIESFTEMHTVEIHHPKDPQRRIENGWEYINTPIHMVSEKRIGNHPS